jgi:hypothetical protein
MTGKYHLIILLLMLLGFLIGPVYAVNNEVAQDGTAGAVTITSAGNQSYLLGQEIQFSGVNLESGTVYLFITGPGLAPEGAPLLNPQGSVYGGGWTTVGVLDDNTWAYVWKTAPLDIDAGTYTIYAASDPRATTNLAGSSYGTISVKLNTPFVTASVSPSIIISGQTISVKGVVEGKPSTGVAVWIIGENFTSISTESVNTDGTYEYKISEAVTSGMTSGQYFVIVQHPMQNNIFDVIRQGDYVVGASPVRWTNLFKISGEGSLQGSEAADALTVALDDPAIDDTYSQVQFQVSPNPPQLPHAFYGTVTIEGKPAPVNTNVSTTVAGGKDEINYILTTVEGEYGGTDDSSPELMVQGTIEKGAPVAFFVDGKQAEVYDVAAGGQWQETYPFKPGRVTNLNLRVNSVLPAHYYIDASSGKGGGIEPDGLVEVVSGSSVTFTITASPGYIIQNVLIDGDAKGMPDTYTFTNVTGNHTISASFTASDDGGSIDTGTLSVTSIPKGAAIFIDGIPSGQTNTTIQNVAAGTHNVTLTKEGYQTETKLVSVQSGSEHWVAFTLQPTEDGGTATGNLSITSIPKGAAIFIDGIASGQTNTTIQNVAAGTHNVTLTKEGYQTETKLVSVQSGGEHWVAFTLQPTEDAGTATGNLSITSIPKGAAIFIDGIASGQTNTTIQNVVAGTHNVTLTKEGYQTVTKLVSVQSGGEHSVAFTLQPTEDAGTATGNLSVTSIPKGAAIFIDGIASGQTNTIVQNVTAGTHNVTLTKPGYQTETKLVSVQSGEKNSVSFSLLPIRSAGTRTRTFSLPVIPRGVRI